MSADFSRTCEGCEKVVSEPWAKSQTGYRCFADGPRRGYTVGIERFFPYIPAWCPKMEKKERDTQGICGCVPAREPKCRAGSCLHIPALAAGFGRAVK